MDVVLLRDVETLGPQGSVVHVKAGYARNYLLPLGLAVEATAQQLKRVEALKQRQTQHAQQIRADAEAMKQRVEGRPVTLPLTVGAENKVFGSVTAHDITEALQRAGITIEKHTLQLAQPIKSLGMFEIPIRLHPDVTATVRVNIVKA